MTTTLSAQAQFNRAYIILKSLHGEVALMLQNMDELSAELEEDPEYIISQIREASESRPGLELLLDPSKLTVLDTFEDKTALVMAALRAQPYTEAVKIYSVAAGSKKKVIATDDGYVTEIAYVGGDDVHVERIYTRHHPAMSVPAALKVAGLERGAHECAK